MKNRFVFLTKSEELDESFVLGMVAKALSKHGKVLAVDTKNGERKLTSFFEQDYRVVYDVQDLVEGLSTLEQTVLSVDEKLSLIPAAFHKEKGLVNLDSLNDLLDTLDYDFVLVDSFSTDDRFEEIYIVDDKKDLDFSKRNILKGIYDVKDDSVYGVLKDESQEEFDELARRLAGESVSFKNYKKSFFQKVLGTLVRK